MEVRRANDLQLEKLGEGMVGAWGGNSTVCTETLKQEGL